MASRLEAASLGFILPANSKQVKWLASPA